MEGEEAYEEDVFFLRWGQVALPEIIQTHAEGQSELYLEEHFYKVASDCEAFHLEGQLAEAFQTCSNFYAGNYRNLQGDIGQ